MILNLIKAFMMEFIVRVMEEHATSRWRSKISSVLKSSLQGNAWLMEMLTKNFPVRCRPIVKNAVVFIRLSEELQAKST